MTIMFHLSSSEDVLDNFSLAEAIFRECEALPDKLDPETIARMLLAEVEFKKGKADHDCRGNESCYI